MEGSSALVSTPSEEWFTQSLSRLPLVVLVIDDSWGMDGAGGG